MALREETVTDNRPADAIKAEADKTPKASGITSTMPPFEEDGNTIEGETRVVKDAPDASDVVAAAVAATQLADDISRETKAAPASSEETALATTARQMTDRLIEAKRLSISNSLVKRDIVARALKHVIPVEELKMIQIGTFPRITVDNGGIILDKVGELGKWMEFEVVSWAPIVLCVSGEKNDPEANKMIRSSYDGVMLDDGSHSVQEYVRYLRDVKKYKDASAKNYIQMMVMLIASESAPKPVPEEERRLYEVSLAPSSASQWQKAMLEAGIRAARGTEDSSLFRITHVKKVNGANTYGVMTFGPCQSVKKAEDPAK